MCALKHAHVALFLFLFTTACALPTLDSENAVKWLMHCLQQDGAAHAIAPNPACKQPLAHLLQFLSSTLMGQDAAAVDTAAAASACSNTDVPLQQCVVDLYWAYEAYTAAMPSATGRLVGVFL